MKTKPQKPGEENSRHFEKYTFFLNIKVNLFKAKHLTKTFLEKFKQIIKVIAKSFIHVVILSYWVFSTAVPKQKASDIDIATLSDNFTNPFFMRRPVWKAKDQIYEP